MSRVPNIELREKVSEAIKNFPDATYNEIADLLGIPKKQVSYHARHAGIVRRKREGVKYAESLQSVESEIALVKARLAELEQKRENLRIHYEADGANVLVFGVGEQPFSANWRDYLRWLNQNGGQNLREFITKHFINGGVQ